MAVLAKALRLLALCGAAVGSRVREDVEGAGFQISKAGDDCSDVVTRGGRPVTCTVVKRLGGGMQANTQIADIDGHRYVLKETTEPSTVGNLIHEQDIVKKLQKAGFTNMPVYHLEFEAKKTGGAVLVMELLEGFFDLNKGPPHGETADVREVRASAFFLALAGLYKGHISHCDLNPGNAMFSARDPTVAVIIDYGLAAVNWGLPGTCNMGGLPDLGYDGAAWKFIYGKLGAPKGPGTLYAICGKSCDMQAKWNLIVQQSQSTVASWKAAHGESQTAEDGYLVAEEDYESEYPALQGHSGQKPEPVQWPSQQRQHHVEEVKKEEVHEVEEVAGLTVVSTKDEAELIKTGTVVELDGVMGTAASPTIKGQALTINFVPADGSATQFGVRVLWASNKGKLKAKF